MKKKTLSPYQSLCVFAKNVEKVSLFYQQALGLKVQVSDKTHDLLVGQNYEVVVHAVSKAYAQSIEIDSPPKRRDDVALKPAFVVDDLEMVRAAAKANGGFLKPIKQAWRIRGFIVLDGWDPEGNVIQFKQVDPESTTS
jgi:predicted enzyme related to lactoylglutathione lyase